MPFGNSDCNIWHTYISYSTGIKLLSLNTRNLPSNLQTPIWHFLAYYPYSLIVHCDRTDR